MTGKLIRIKAVKYYVIAGQLIKLKVVNYSRLRPCRSSPKTCNSYRNLDITATAGVPQKLAIAIETLILPLLQVFLKNLK